MDHEKKMGITADEEGGEEDSKEISDEEKDAKMKELERQEAQLQEMNEEKNSEFGNLPDETEEEMEAEEDVVKAETTGGMAYDIPLFPLTPVDEADVAFRR